MSLRECCVLVVLSTPLYAQQSATVRAGVPLRIALDRRVPIGHVGDPIQGRLVDPIYNFDRMVLPAGALVEGRIAEIGGVPLRRRVTAILSGNFTPPRDVRAQFDTLVLGDGSRFPLRTAPSRGAAYTARVSKEPKGVRDRIQQKSQAAVLAFTAPGKMNRLKTTLLGMLPYSRQSWRAGTLFNSVLQDPVTVPMLNPTDWPATQEVRARLITTVTSATAQKGGVVEAVVTQPQFSADRRLLIPEGSRLIGEVVKAQKARYLHRNGKLLFVFRQIQLPTATAQAIRGDLEGVEVDSGANLALDSEGATRATSPKTRFIFPAIAVAVAGLSFHQDYNSQGVADQDIAGRAESGAVGLGLIGTVVAQASRTLASGIALTGAGFSVYTTFLARGQDVILPQNTPVTVTLNARPEGGTRRR
ncbi:MAG: hypothetical protein ABI693_23155 [Bryobacteraceae bacterium]